MPTDTRRLLLWPALAWVVMDLAHLADHVRQDRDLAAEVRVVGISGYIATALLLFLIARRHHLAPFYSVAFGISVVVGFVAVHVLPHWSAISDPYADFNTDALNWALIVLPIASAVWLIQAGLKARTAGNAAVASV